MIKLNNKYLFIVCLVSLIGYSYFMSSSENIMFETIKSVKHNHIYFDSRTSQSDLSSIKEFQETSESEFNEVRVSFKMLVYAISGYNNIFQLAPDNSGIRMELSKPATVGVLVGYNDKSKIKGFTLTDSLRLNQWYQFTLNLDRNKRLKMTLNGEIIGNFEPDQGLNYKISDIVVGAGFSKLRKFDGKINDFSINYQLLVKRHPLSRFIILNIKYLFGFVMLLTLFFLLIPIHPKI